MVAPILGKHPFFYKAHYTYTPAIFLVMLRLLVLRMSPVQLVLLSAASVGDFNNRRLAVLVLPTPCLVDLVPHNSSAIKNVQSQNGIRASLKHLE